MSFINQKLNKCISKYPIILSDYENTSGKYTHLQLYIDSTHRELKKKKRYIL